MTNSAPFDLNALAAVKPGLDSTLVEISAQLELYLGAPANNAAALVAARAELHRLLGVLKMVGLDGVAVFCTELEIVLSELAANPQQVSGMHRDVLRRALFGITHYLDALANGADNAALRLFPQYQELQQLRGLEMAFELDLFYPDLVVQLPQQVLDAPPQGDTPASLKALRSQYQQGLLRWLRQEDVSATAQLMQQALDGVMRRMPPDDSRAFWWLGCGLLDCLKLDGLPPELNARKLLGRIDQQMRAVAEGNAGDAQPVLNEMLYLIGRSHTVSELVEEIKQLYALDNYLPELSALQFGEAAQLLDVMRDQLRVAEESWEQCVQGDANACKKFIEYAEHLAAQSEKLDRNTLQFLAKQIKGLSQYASTPEHARLITMDMAMALLLLGSGIENYDRLGSGFQEQARILSGRMQAAVKQQPEDAQQLTELVELHGQMEQGDAMIPLANEMLANLQHVEQGLNAFFNDAVKRDALTGLLRLLGQIQGGLRISSLDQAGQLLASVQDNVRRLAQGDDTPTPMESRALANAVSALENYLQHLAHGQAGDVLPLQAALTGMTRPQQPTAPAATAPSAQPQPPAPATTATVEQPQAPEPPAITPFEPPPVPAPATTAPVEQVSEPMEIAPVEPLLASAPVEQPQAPEPPAIALFEPPPVPAPAPTAPIEQPPAPAPIQRPIDEDRELLDIFLEEAQEVLGIMRDNLEICQLHPDSREPLVTIRRGFHTFKGSGRMVGLTDLGEVAWCVERAMNKWLQDNKPATPGLLHFINGAVQSFAGWVDALNNQGVARIEAGDLIAAAQQIEDGIEPASEDRGLVAAARQSFDKGAAEPHNILSSVLRPPSSDAAPAPEFGLELEPELVPAPELEPASEPEAEPASAPAPEFEFELESASEPEPELTPEPAPAPAEEVVVIGDITLSQALFKIASTEIKQLVAALYKQFKALRAAAPPVVQYDFMRAAHTLVGVNRTMGFAAVVDLADALEDWLKARVEQPFTLNDGQLQMLEQSIAALDEMVISICGLQMPQMRSDLAYQLLADRDKLREAVTEPASTPAPVKPAAAHVGTDKPQVRDDVDEQLLPVFLEEADDLCPKIDAVLRAWREHPHDEQQEQSLNRLLHTIKGSARMVGAMRIGEIVHEMEDRVLAAARLRDEAGYWDTLENDFDRIAVLLEELRGGKAVAVADKGAETGQAEAAQRAPDQAGGERREGRRAPEAGLRVRSDVVDKLVNEAGEISVARSRMETELRAFKESLLELTGSVARLRQQLRELEIQAEGQMQAHISLAKDSTEQFDPLEFDRFTRLQELTRFMNESVHDVQTVQQSLLKNIDETASALLAQGRLNRELQQSLMNVRMVPFNSIADRLYRIVRQTGKEMGKRANLELQGASVELDRSVLEKMTAPFEHLLRNAIAHGLENDLLRKQSGKPPIGEIRLHVRQESNEVVFEISDDGAGLNLAALREKAVAKGLLRADEAASEAQLAQLIFASGFSTATEITEIAGRGIGMDVVRSEIAALGGRIDVRSRSGQGTQFIIHLPLTLAVMQTLMVRAGDATYAIPSAMVEQVSQVKSADMPALHRKRQVEWQGRIYPLHYFPHLLGDMERAEENHPRNSVLLLRSGEQRIALHVDELLGNRETLVKNIGPQLARLPGIAGATVLGNGEVVLIMNPPQLAQRIGGVSKAVEAASAKPLHTLPLIMVVDDSLTVRKITTRMLTRAGYQVVTATDGVDALEKLEEFTPEVMLLDIEMPRMDGFALARQLRRDPKTHDMPIIMITSRTADKHRDYAMQLGVNTYLGKPYQEDVLLQNIADFVAVHKLDA